MKIFRSIFIVFAVFSACKSTPSGALKQEKKNETPYVILISIDGFRYDYAEKHGARHIQKMGEEGVRAESMTSVFPSKTFPNHYSIVTGLYAENHGLVSNTFYDPKLDLTYKISNRERVEDGRFYGGTPLWTLAEQQGMKSACYFWVGSEAPINEIRPSYYYIYDGSVPNQKRVDQVIDWLKLPGEERPHFITLYFSDVDSKGHSFGPDAVETKMAVQEIDALIGNLSQRVNALDLPVNIIIVSDHGMIEVDRENPIRIEQMADFSKVNPVITGSHVLVYGNDPAEIDRLHEELIPLQGDSFLVYKKADIPDSLHFKNHHRIGELLLIANAPKEFVYEGQRFISPGAHGFDPYRTPEMGAIFYANGPNVKRGMVIPSFENVHVYPLVAEILGLKVTEEIDGKLGVLKRILK
ncbi:MAG: ectonucleotide pyrophosphatase/phosphodiesterase [Bacteroidia bacterium]